MAANASCGEHWASADFSPSGRWIAAFQGPPLGPGPCERMALWLIRSRSGARRLVAVKPELAGVWSPRNDRIAYATVPSQSSTLASLFVTTPRGRRRLIATGNSVLFRWSPDGRWLGYSTAGKLRIARADGSHPRLIVRQNGFISFSWSPDSRRLVYLEPHGPNDEAAIVVVDRNGQNRHQIATGYGAGWSGDGRWIAFSAHSEASWRDIDVIRPDGTGERTVASGCYRADWSPRASRLLVWYAGDCGVFAGDFKLSVIDPATGSILLQDRGNPQWSPDGRRLAIVRGYSEPQLTLVDADGSNQVDVQGLTTTPFETEWSPSGESLAFGAGSPTQIFVVNSVGSDMHQVAVGEEPLWSPGGQRLLYKRFRPGCGNEIWIMRLRSGTSRRLLNCR
jgi:Tol biopolymer transport system component